jgi:hypothetical protein
MKVHVGGPVLMGDIFVEIGMVCVATPPQVVLYLSLYLAYGRNPYVQVRVNRGRYNTNFWYFYTISFYNHVRVNRGNVVYSSLDVPNGVKKVKNLEDQLPVVYKKLIKGPIGNTSWRIVPWNLGTVVSPEPFVLLNPGKLLVRELSHP